MGRRDAVQFTLELVAEWRRLGAEVTFEPGWERRGNGYGSDYEGCVVHHTASPSSAATPFPTQNVLRDGRPGLTGPLCNSAGPWCSVDRPRIHVMAAFPANHAGASGGRSMGPLPVTSLFNPKAWGHEIDYAGLTEMATGQRLAALIVGRGVANVLRRSTEYVRAHAETSVTGKWDPGYSNGKTIDMATFRRDAAQVSGGQPAVFQEDPDMRVIQQKDRGIAVVGPGYYKGLSPDELPAAGAMFGSPVIFNTAAEFDRAVAVTTGGQAISDGKPLLGELHGKIVDSRFGLDDRPGLEKDDMLGHILSIRGALTKLASGGVDVKALAAEILASMDVKTSVQEALREGTGTAA